MSASKRDDILRAAFDLFSRYGFRAITVDRVAAEAHATKVTVYYHFPTKTDLMVAVLQDRHQRVLRDLRQGLQDRADVESRLKAIFDWHARWYRSDDFAGCLFEKALAEFSQDDGLVRQVAVDHKNALLTLLRDVLIERYPRRQATELARTILILLDGATASAWALQQMDAARRSWTVAEMLLKREAKGV